MRRLSLVSPALLYLSGNTSEAVVRAEALAKADPGFAEAWILLARLAVAEGERTLAVQYYQTGDQTES